MQAALDAFSNLLGAKGFSQDSAVLQPWLTDWRGKYTGRAAALLSPANTAEVSAILKIASTHRIAVVPQGGNSGMVAGATPDSSGHAVLLSTRRMNQITPIAPGGNLAECQSGVILQMLHDAAHDANMRFPLTLGGKGSATIGGLVATNAGGTQVLQHGNMRQLVAGLEAVLSNGDVFDGLSYLKKDNRGYDINQLLIGSEGTLAIITKVALHLSPALIDRCVIWAGVSSPQAAYTLLQQLQHKAGTALEGFELMPDSSVQSVLRHIAGTRPPLAAYHPWHVLIELAQDHVDKIASSQLAETLMSDAAGTGLIGDAVLSANETQADAFWKIRDSIAEAERADGPALQHDISVPVGAMAAFITTESAAVEAKFPGTKAVAFGHMGDGNIHFHVKAPADDAANWLQIKAAAVASHVYDRVTAYKGSISAEHGIGQLKIAEFARLADPARLLILRNIKSAFDPLGIMNPGKLVPLA